MPAKIRDLTSEELCTLLKGSTASVGNRWVAADELHQRGGALPLAQEELTMLARSLSKAEQKQCYANAYQFSLASLQLLEWVRHERGEEIRKWSVSFEDRQSHHLDLTDLMHELQGAEKASFIWNEWMKDWSAGASFTGWMTGKPFAFDQATQKEPSRTQDEPRENLSDASLNLQSNTAVIKRNSSWPVILGLAAVVGTPYWIFMIFTAIASGYETFLGPILPVIFAIVMSAMSIPVSVGLFQRKKWAWGFYVYATLVALIWFGGHFIIDDAGRIWLAMTVFAGIMLTFATIAKDEFQ